MWIELKLAITLATIGIILFGIAVGLDTICYPRHRMTNCFGFGGLSFIGLAVCSMLFMLWYRF